MPKGFCPILTSFSKVNSIFFSKIVEWSKIICLGREMVGTLLKKCKNLSGKLTDLLAANQKGLKIETPSTMNKDLVLKPYQKRGLHWYTQVHQMKMGGILADEMGLGKTVQTISFLAWLKLNQPSFTRPHLVVCPSSTLENWKREFECWLPSFKIHLYYGEHRYEIIKCCGNPIVLC